MSDVRGRSSAVLAVGALTALALAPAWLATPSPVRADPVIAVTTTDDVVAADGHCSLREAIIAANTNAAVGGCPAGKPRIDNVDLPPGTYRLAIAGPDEDDAATGDLDILESLNLTGVNGDQVSWDPQTTVIDGAGLDRVFDVHPSAQLVGMHALTVTGGMTDDEGGGIRLVGQPVDPADCTTHVRAFIVTVIVRGNGATRGGGVSVGTCTEFEAEQGLAVIDNQATADGGGLAVHEGDTLPILSGAVISANVAAERGGGIWAPNWVSGSVILSDIVDNRAETGGGVYIESGEPFALNFHHTIFSANEGGNCWFGTGYPRDAAYTLSSDTSCTFTGQGNLAAADPLLFPRDASPVGYRLQPGSPAIDAGAPAATWCNAPTLYDRYDNVRPQDGDGDGVTQCDIGMYEFPASSVPDTAVLDSRPDRAAVAWLISIGLLGPTALWIGQRRRSERQRA